MEHSIYGKEFIQADDNCGICKILLMCARNANSDFIYDLPRSVVILGKKQFYKGYCIVLFKGHKTELFQMTEDERNLYFKDVSTAAQAISNVFQSDKINYEILGNTEPHIHCHLFPRKHMDEYFRSPIWTRPEDKYPKVLPTAMELEGTIKLLQKELDKLVGKI
jgi:diadenosine tetraphosphate (Ap4A) HIT family hydrolase